MDISIITHRIKNALEEGGLKSAPDGALFQTVNNIADLLRPWEETFPGIDLNVGNVPHFGRGIIRRGPKFNPSPRMSKRPLPPPRPIIPSPLVLDRGLFQSTQAIWDYYQTKDGVDPRLLDCAFSDIGIEEFLGPLCSELADYHPLGMLLEDVMHCNSISNLSHFQLMVPHYVYDDEAAATVMAFLSGAESIAGHLTYFFEEQDRNGDDSHFELHPKDVSLIEQIGFEELLHVYTKFPGGKSYDLWKLFNWYENFFASLCQHFPEHMENDWPIVSDGGMGTEFDITRKEDIEFGISYAEAFCELINAMPDPYQFEWNEGGLVEIFIHELCEVWRKSNNKRLVKWISPKSQTLLQRIKVGAI
jgi:hypothetical protein